MTVTANLLFAFGLQALLIATPLAIGLALFVRMTGDLHPRLRYLLAGAVFVAIPMGAMFLSGTAATAEASSGNSRSVVTTPSTNNIEREDRGLENAVRPVALLWLVVSSVLIVREIGGHLLLATRTRRYPHHDLVIADAVHDVRLADEGVPMTVGLLQPRIILPKRALDELTPAILESVVRHEASHATWRDPLVHAVVRITRFLLWPVLPIHYVGLVINREAELAADRQACVAHDDDAVADYAETLVDAARWQRNVVANLAPSLTHGSLEQRIRRLFERPRRSFVRLAAAITTTILAGVVAAGVPAVSPASTSTDDSGRTFQVQQSKIQSSSTISDAIQDSPAVLEPQAEPQPESSSKPTPASPRTEPSPDPAPASLRSEPAPQSVPEPSSQPGPLENPLVESEPDPEPEPRTTYRGEPLESQEVDEQIVTRNVIKIQDQRIRNVIKIRNP